MEDLIKEKEFDIRNMTLNELDVFWDEAKLKLKKS
jgi:uncharacterized protein YabN with tetrapyrrole methylase and pyrophosphatase domain